ncbi:Bestrophin, RFP-TM, chloride channel-domain-containing protein [Amanita rubescens]|nr:Bestrophin, RFP-TM, chloride channel-domain-containing protein [Amanita rubescens]
MKRLNVLPTTFKAPRIRRAHLRPYSWLPDVFRIKGSIIRRIVGPVLTITLYATLVAYTSSKGYHVVLSNSIVPMLSVVVGLILVFRNSTSYDRYWEGRKSFAQMISNTRSLTRLLWVNVALPPTDGDPAYAKGKTPQPDITSFQLRRRKAEALRLCLFFVFATKHYLRGEDGMDHEDYQGIIPQSFVRSREIPSASRSRSHSRQGRYDATKQSDGSSLVANAPGDSPSDTTSVYGHSQHGTNKIDATKRVRVKRRSMPLPLSRSLFRFKREGFLETVGPAGTNQMSQLVISMVDQLTAMERVANTPIPISYGIHLKQCVTLYLFALPLTLLNELGWAMVPIVTVVAFTFMGIEGIADEIEMPFGIDERDLPLDRYCEDLKEEIYYIINQLNEGGAGGYGYDDGEGDD